jgi:NADP-dependent 3-hydroxy acid dehydrogenase YdfG
MRRSFRDRVVVVTGASSGVGRAIARAFGERGARVGLIARNERALRNAALEIERTGGHALVLPCDVADAAAVEASAARVEDEWGHIDVWVNDAMVSVFSPALEMTAQEYERVTRVSYLGTVHGTLAALKRMRARNRGIVIQIGSALAYRSIPLQSAYCGSKAAVRGFTDSVRCELHHDKSGVRISMLQLPAVNTPQFDVVRSRLPRRAQPVPPIFQPEVIARSVLYAARHAPRELWIGRSTLLAIAAARLAPGFADRYLGRTGYRAQQTGEPLLPGRPDNLDRPLRDDRGAHGRFEARSRRRSVLAWLRRRPWLTGLAASLALAGAMRGAGAR